MNADKRVETFIAAKRLKLGPGGVYSGVLIPYISIPMKNGRFPAIPPRLDEDGDAMVRLYPRSNAADLASMGWIPYKAARKPANIAKTEKEE